LLVGLKGLTYSIAGSCDVPADFTSETKAHCCSIALRLVSKTKVDVENEIDAEDRSVEGIPGQICSVIEGGRV
jgi:hypothetical protein